MKLSVIGLGKLGLCTAACFASKGHDVIGFDINPVIMSSLQNRQCPIDENDLPDLLDQSWEKLHFTQDVESIIHNTDITLIIIATPSDESHRFSNKYILKALDSISPHLKSKTGFHVINVVSTVMPGSCQQEFIPFLEKATGKACGEDFGFVYNPEFIALGSVIRDFLNPDMILIGASDSKSANLVEDLFKTTINNAPQFSKMGLINAEITKLSLNCFVTMKISFANELASICENVPAADIDVITQAIGADRRVGRTYFKAGLGFGGPCFPRDNYAFQAFASDYGQNAHLGKQVIAINNQVVQRLHNIVRKYLTPLAKVTILGLSYKPETHIIEQSQPLQLARVLQREGYEVTLHDPKALSYARESLGNTFEYTYDLERSVIGSKAVILMTAWSSYQEMNWDLLDRNINKDTLLVDCWRILKNRDFKNFRYIGFGSNAKI